MRVLVTGGGGFLGAAIAKRLLERGDAVRTFSRGRHAELDALDVDHVRGDISDPVAVKNAARGCDAVVHTAAKAGVWGSFDEYRRANVLGTANVLSACRAHGVGRLVYTSTPSVVHAGGDIEGGDESLPYAERPKSAYQATKIAAERAALGAARDGLSVVALRPHLIWGPGDPHLVPRIVERARRGRVALPGGGAHLIDTVYVDNAADAHVAAIDRVEARGAYFVTNGEPRPLAEIVLAIVRAAGADAKVVSIPRPLAHAAGALLETVFRAARVEREPPLTRFVAEQLSTAHWFSIAAAERDLGWTPKISIDEGMERLRRYFASRAS